MKLCIVSSSGGHLFKTILLKPWWKNYQRFWVVKSDDMSIDLLKNEIKYYGYFPENRNLLNFVKNFFLAVKILNKEKPDILFSTGAGIAPPFFFVAKVMGIKTIFLETFIFIHQPTLSGKIIYYLADYFLIQHQQLKKYYPQAKYIGKLI